MVLLLIAAGGCAVVVYLDRRKLTSKSRPGVPGSAPVAFKKRGSATGERGNVTLQHLGAACGLPQSAAAGRLTTNACEHSGEMPSCLANPWVGAGWFGDKDEDPELLGKS